MNSRPKSKWLRFSLRTLLLLTAIVGVSIGILANRAKRQNDTLAAIRQIGGSYRVSNNSDSFVLGILQKFFGDEAFANVRAVSLRDTNASDELVAKLSRLRSISDLDLSSTKTTDHGVLAISNLPLRILWLQSCPITEKSGLYLSKLSSLQMLSLNGTECSDRFLENLGPHSNIKDIGLRGTKVTSDGMRFLNLLPSLEKLRLYDTIVDDDGIGHLDGNLTITLLDLSMTKISDNAFPCLKTLAKLEYVDLNACNVTRKAVDAFDAETTCKVDCNVKR